MIDPMMGLERLVSERAPFRVTGLDGAATHWWDSFCTHWHPLGTHFDGDEPPGP